MKDLPRPAQAYIVLVAMLAVGVVAGCLLALRDQTPLWAAVCFTAAGVAVLDAFPIVIYGEVVEMTISSTAKFAAALLFPAPVAILGTFLGTLIAEAPRTKRAWFKRLFNVCEMTITFAVVATVYHVIREPGTDIFDSPRDIIAIALAGATDFALNSAFVSLAISLASGLPFRYVWSRNYSQSAWHDLSTVPLGVFLAVLWRYNPVSIVLAGLPLIVVQHSYMTSNDLQRQTHQALTALVRVIDQRDQSTFDHSERVSKYARMIAQELDLPQEEIEIIAPAALLHDLGKVGMRDDILFKPKLLNPQERKSAEGHAEIGADLLSQFPLFEKGAELVRHHHERYDGKGYPDRLKGEEIPIGSRIIAIADAYQAMTEERPYRRAKTISEAIVEIQAMSGTQFDPRVVRAFVKVLREESPLQEPAPASTPATVRV